jgi:hypothetical protein
VNSPAIPRLPVGACFRHSRELVKPSLRSTACLTSATGNWVELPWALYMMAAVDHRTALLLNQSGKVRNLNTGESRGYKLLYGTRIQKKDRSLQGNGALGRLELPTLGLPGGGKREQ